MNDSYYNFGCNFLKSAKILGGVNEIKVVNTGLNEENKESILSYGCNLIESGIDTSGQKTSWDADWHKNVTFKTKFLLETLKNSNKPIVMIDSDTVFIDDISDLIDDAWDIQLCERDNHPVRYLASFFVAHPTDKTISFIENWISIMEQAGDTPSDPNGVTIAENKYGLFRAKESPALTYLMDNLNGFPIEIKKHRQEEVSATVQQYLLNKESTRIINFKSNLIGETFEQRLRGLDVESILE